MRVTLAVVEGEAVEVAEDKGVALAVADTVAVSLLVPPALALTVEVGVAVSVACAEIVKVMVAQRVVVGLPVGSAGLAEVVLVAEAEGVEEGVGRPLALPPLLGVLVEVVLTLALGVELELISASVALPVVLALVLGEGLSLSVPTAPPLPRALGLWLALPVGEGLTLGLGVSRALEEWLALTLAHVLALSVPEGVPEAERVREKLSEAVAGEGEPPSPGLPLGVTLGLRGELPLREGQGEALRLAWLGVKGLLLVGVKMVLGESREAVAQALEVRVTRPLETVCEVVAEKVSWGEALTVGSALALGQAETLGVCVGLVVSVGSLEALGSAVSVARGVKVRVGVVVPEAEPPPPPPPPSAAAEGVRLMLCVGLELAVRVGEELSVTALGVALPEALRVGIITVPVGLAVPVMVALLLPELLPVERGVKEAELQALTVPPLPPPPAPLPPAPLLPVGETLTEAEALALAVALPGTSVTLRTVLPVALMVTVALPVAGPVALAVEVAQALPLRGAEPLAVAVRGGEGVPLP